MARTKDGEQLAQARELANLVANKLKSLAVQLRNGAPVHGVAQDLVLTARDVIAEIANLFGQTVPEFQGLGKRPPAERAQPEDNDDARLPTE
jgi:hypothetical protein